MGLEDDLGQFMGSEVFYRNPVGRIIYTEGVKYLAQEAGAYWLIDLVGSWQYKHGKIPFQLWRLEVDDKHQAVATMRVDTGEPILAKQEIAYTDFPLQEFEFYVIDGTMLLKSEY